MSFNDPEVTAWAKRLNRKGPFFLLRKEDGSTVQWDHSKSPPIKSDIDTTIYWVIWNDGPKTKLGSFEDYMCTRYGVRTKTVLNGDTPFDLWNGAGTRPSDFAAMVEVRNGISTLPKFSLDVLIGLRS